MTTEYHKIQTLFERDPATNYKTVIEGKYALPEFEYLRQLTWVYTEKVDGTNIRIFAAGAAVPFRGKTDGAVMQPNLVATIEEARERLMRVSDGAFIFYGEGFGSGVQKVGSQYRQDTGFVLFDVAAIKDRGLLFLERSNVEDIAKRAGVEVVPIVGAGSLETMVPLVARGFPSRWGSAEAEGIVARPALEMQDRLGRRIITKLKCKDFAQ